MHIAKWLFAAVLATASLYGSLARADEDWDEPHPTKAQAAPKAEFCDPGFDMKTPPAHSAKRQARLALRRTAPPSTLTR